MTEQNLVTSLSTKREIHRKYIPSLNGEVEIKKRKVKDTAEFYGLITEFANQGKGDHYFPIITVVCSTNLEIHDADGNVITDQKLKVEAIAEGVEPSVITEIYLACLEINPLQKQGAVEEKKSI